MHDERELKQFDRWGVPRPAHSPHGTPDEIRANLKPLEAISWHLDGNKLVAETEFGPVINYIPSNYIMRGVDKNNLPILEELVL